MVWLGPKGQSVSLPDKGEKRMSSRIPVKKLCPLSFYPRIDKNFATIECDASCAWFDKETNTCIIVKLANVLEAHYLEMV